MSNTKKALLIALPLLLAAAAAIVFSYDTLAAYFQSLTETSAPIYAKGISFHIDGSDAETRFLGDLSVAPDETRTWLIQLDARGTEVPLNAVLTLSLEARGTWPPGLTVTLNGQSAESGGSIPFTQIERSSPQTVEIAVSWDVAGNAAAYPPGQIVSIGGNGNGNGNAYGHDKDKAQGNAYGHDKDKNKTVTAGNYMDRAGNVYDLSAYGGFSLSAAVTVTAEQQIS